MDPLRHPDLVEVGRRLRSTFDRAAAADLEAARLAHARARSLRDLLLEWEDLGHRLRVSVGDRELGPMLVLAVGRDHVLLADGGRAVAVPLPAITRVEADT